MSDQKDKILERIKKLFALGSSANQHEAELAIQKANELMAEYQIAARDVDLLDDGAITQEDFFLEEGFRLKNAIGQLVRACATLYDGQYSQRAADNDGKLRYRFYGPPTDIYAMTMTFHHLYGSWKSIVIHDIGAAKGAGLVRIVTFRTSHLYGYAEALQKRAEELSASRLATVKAATGRDLVIVKGNALKDYLSRQNLRAGRARASFSQDGYTAGIERGNRAALNGAATNGKGVLRITKR